MNQCSNLFSERLSVRITVPGGRMQNYAALLNFGKKNSQHFLEQENCTRLPDNQIPEKVLVTYVVVAGQLLRRFVYGYPLQHSYFWICSRI